MTMPRSTCRPSSRPCWPRPARRRARLPASRRAWSASSYRDTPCSRRFTTTSPRRRPYTAGRWTVHWAARSRWPCSPWIASGWTRRYTRSRLPQPFSLGGLCIRAVTINHCTEIEPASASWVFTRPDGTEEEREPWSCAPDTPPISHVELIAGHELIYEGVPNDVCVALEQELGIDRYMRNWTDAVRRAMGLPHAGASRARSAPRRDDRHHAALRDQAERRAGSRRHRGMADHKQRSA